MFKTAGVEELETPGKGVHSSLAQVQEKTAILPDYSLKKAETGQAPAKSAAKWPGPDLGTSISGIVGGLFTLILVIGIGFFLRKKN
jgi:cobalt/nickel transport system permease protein